MIERLVELGDLPASDHAGRGLQPRSSVKFLGLLAKVLSTASVIVALCSAVFAESVREFAVPEPGPSDITAGPDGNLWFTFQGNKIGRITPSGVITEFALSADSAARSITAGPDGNLWFTQVNGAIGRITPRSPHTISEFRLPKGVLAGASGITAGADGNLWFTETNTTTNAIGQITPGGVITEFPISTPSAAPEGITTGPDGNVWFAEILVRKIGRITPRGGITEFALPNSEGRGPFGITAGPDGNVWFTDGAFIGRITPSGVIKEFPIAAGFGTFFGITTGPDGNLWFLATSQSEPEQVGRMAPDGVTAPMYPIPTRDCLAFHITTGSDRNLWFTEVLGKKIGRVVPPVTHGNARP